MSYQKRKTKISISYNAIVCDACGKMIRKQQKRVSFLKKIKGVNGRNQWEKTNACHYHPNCVEVRELTQ